MLLMPNCQCHLLRINSVHTTSKLRCSRKLGGFGVLTMICSSHHFIVSSSRHLIPDVFPQGFVLVPSILIQVFQPPFYLLPPTTYLPTTIAFALHQYSVGHPLGRGGDSRFFTSVFVSNFEHVTNAVYTLPNLPRGAQHPRSYHVMTYQPTFSTTSRSSTLEGTGQGGTSRSTLGYVGSIHDPWISSDYRQFHQHLIPRIRN